MRAMLRALGLGLRRLYSASNEMWQRGPRSGHKIDQARGAAGKAKKNSGLSRAPHGIEF